MRSRQRASVLERRPERLDVHADVKVLHRVTNRGTQLSHARSHWHPRECDTELEGEWRVLICDVISRSGACGYLPCLTSCHSPVCLKIVSFPTGRIGI